MESKLLRKLAKIAGFPPQNVYRQRPADLQEMLKEKWPDIDEWDAAKANEVIEAASASSKKETEEVKENETVKEEAKSPPKKAKRTRRTKAQIQADKEKEAAAKKEEDAPKEKAVVEKKPLPTRRRKKKAPPQNTLENVLLGKLALLDERLTNIEASLAKRSTKQHTGYDDAALTDIAAFLAWFHNTIDTKDPITSLSEVDWEDCIDSQIKK